MVSDYLVTLRKGAGLSQDDVAALLDVTPSALSRFENRSRPATLELAIAAEVIFGHGAKDIFPALYADIKKEVVLRARVRATSYAHRIDSAARSRLRFLEGIVARACQTTLGL